MYKCKDDRLKPEMINGCSLSQTFHLEEIGGHLLEIIGKDSSVLGKVLLRWSPRWLGSNTVAPRLERRRTNSGLLGYTVIFEIINRMIGQSVQLVTALTYSQRLRRRPFAGLGSTVDLARGTKRACFINHRQPSPSGSTRRK
jgi:hypothetical protein